MRPAYIFFRFAKKWPKVENKFHTPDVNKKLLPLERADKPRNRMIQMVRVRAFVAPFVRNDHCRHAKQMRYSEKRERGLLLSYRTLITIWGKIRLATERKSKVIGVQDFSQAVQR